MRCVRFEDLKTGFIGIGFINGDSITRVQGSLETYWQITAHALLQGFAYN